jgi:nicotinamidase-related amidase
MSIKTVHLLIIDPQQDFCDPKGALSVPGADEDMKRVATMIDRLGGKFDDIHITLDSHHFVDVAHPVMWKDSSGKHPDPFTVISASDVADGVWTPVQAGLTKRMIKYVQALEAGGRYPLCIWPPHCLIGSPGHNVVPELFEAIRKWEEGEFAIADYVTKGSNVYTEHYSAVKAEVPDPEDPSTQLNSRLIMTLQDADLVAIAGEAGSHCLANTVRDIAAGFGDDSYVKKLVLLTDGTSPVATFEQLQEDFVNEMTGRGMQLSTTTDFLA